MHSGCGEQTSYYYECVILINSLLCAFVLQSALINEAVIFNRQKRITILAHSQSRQAGRQAGGDYCIVVVQYVINLHIIATVLVAVLQINEHNENKIN